MYTTFIYHTVDGSEIRLTTKDDDYPIIYRFSLHPRWCRILSINSTSRNLMEMIEILPKTHEKQRHGLFLSSKQLKTTSGQDQAMVQQLQSMRQTEDRNSSLKLTASLPLKIGHRKRKLNLPNNQFSVANLLLVSGRVPSFPRLKGGWPHVEIIFFSLPCQVEYLARCHERGNLVVGQGGMFSFIGVTSQYHIVGCFGGVLHWIIISILKYSMYCILLY